MQQAMKYIYEVYRERSFSRAAQNLYVSQPCLSAMVKKTEEELGAPIFDRSTSPIRLTEFGEQYIAYLEQLQELDEDLLRRLADLNGLKKGSLALGANNVYSSFVVPQAISRFHRRYPGVQVQLFEGNIAHLEEGLAKGTLDLVIDNCPMEKSSYQKRIIGSEQLLLAVCLRSSAQRRALPPGRLQHQDILAGRHLSAQTPALDLSAFSEADFIALRQGNDTRIRMDALCREAGFSPRIRLEVDQLATAYNIVCSDIGSTLVSDTLVAKTPSFANVFYYKLASPQATRFSYFYRKRTKYVTHAMRRFMDIFISEMQQALPGRLPAD